MVGVVSPSGVCRGVNVPADDVVPTISSRCLRAPVQIAEMWAATVAWTTSEAAACEERHLFSGGWEEEEENRPCSDNVWDLHSQPTFTQCAVE